jgi:hypothetical protein
MFLFIGHIHHKITKSAGFALDVLKQSFGSADIYQIDPYSLTDIERLACLRMADYEFVVLWQMDYLAHAFSTLQIPVIVYPMYDASSSLDQVHWESLSSSLIFNFSLNLHKVSACFGCRSYYLKYAPEAPDDSSPEKIYDNSVFFWQRRPQSQINIESVQRMFAGTVERMHVHQFSDSGVNVKLSGVDPEIELTQSAYFQSNIEYLRILDSFSCYVAPRLTEGIGFGFLEAMARGLVVIANDEPTHNEYIKNFTNGILFCAGRGDRIDLRSLDLQAIGSRAKKTVQVVHANWTHHYSPLMVDAIRAFRSRFRGTSKTIKLNVGVLHALSSLHTNQKTYYEFLTSLQSVAPTYGLSIALDAERIGDFQRAETAFRNLLSNKRSPEIYGLFYKLFRDRMELRAKVNLLS